jgi:protein TonB
VGKTPFPHQQPGRYFVTLTSPSWSRVRERGGGLLFALGLNALLLLALLTLSPQPEPRVEDPRQPVTFEMAAAPEARAEKSEQRQEKRAEAAEARKPAVVQPPRPVEPPTEEQPATLPFLQLDRAQMASADIGKMARKDAGEGASGQGDSRMAAGPGEGPGGVHLFEAEWYRRPSHAELSTYLPASAPGDGWGLVACKTVENFRVENCQALGESPQGSGFARAVRLAAWQFMVRPPRVNGKPMIGSWVRIRIDYSRKLVDGGAAGM